MSHKMKESMRWLAICCLYEDWEFALPEETGLTGPVMSAVENWPYEGHPYRRLKVWKHRDAQGRTQRRLQILGEMGK